MTWIFLAVLCVVFSLYIAVPLFQKNAREYSPLLSTSDVRYESVQRQKRELQLDHGTGKMDDAEFHRLNLELELEESVATTRLQTRNATFRPVIATQNTTELALEVEIQIARARNRTVQPAKKPPLNVDETVEKEIEKARVRSGVESAHAETESDVVASTGWTCPSCARQMSAADRFCASCGAANPAPSST